MESRGGQVALLCHILSKSVNLLLRYGDFFILQDGGCLLPYICVVLLGRHMRNTWWSLSQGKIRLQLILLF